MLSFLVSLCYTVKAADPAAHCKRKDVTPMKKLIALLLAMSICVLCVACGGDEAPETTGAPVESTAAATVPSESEEMSSQPATDAPALYTNPFTGEPMEAPLTTRPVVVSISNIPDALPHRGISDADIVFESLVNASIVRCLALYSDITGVESIGSTRSARPILIDIASHYNAFYAHAGGSKYTNSLFGKLSNMNVDTPDDSGYAYRDQARNKASSWEHCLFIRGTELMDHIVNKKNVDMSMDADTSFGLQFVEDGTPADGETANTISIALKYGNTVKETIMVYNAETGLYEYNQYGKTMIDEATSMPEAFTNVIIMYTKMSYNEGYHFADFVSGGNGYFACGGKIIPIQWKCAGEDQPFTFYTADGQPLNLGVGTSYIALTVDGAPVTCE